MSPRRYRCKDCGTLLVEGASQFEADNPPEGGCGVPPLPKFTGKLIALKRYTVAGGNAFRVFVDETGRRVDVQIKSRSSFEWYEGIRDAREEARYLFAAKYPDTLKEVQP